MRHELDIIASGIARVLGRDLRVPLPYVEVFVYKRGTTDEVDIYASELGGLVLSQPIKADWFGRVGGFVEPGSLEVVYSDPSGRSYRRPYEALSALELGGREREFVQYTAIDDSARAAGGGIGGFQVAYGPTGATVPIPSNSPFQISWESTGRPVICEARLVVQQSGSLANYVWGTIHLLGGSTAGVNLMPDLRGAAVSAFITLMPAARFNDVEGTERTVSAAIAPSAGSSTVKGSVVGATLQVREL